MSNPISYLQAPSVIVNQALDRLGADEEKIIGDITDGTRVAEAARRNYGQALRQLLRTSHWDFARKRAKLQLLGDATGQSSAPVTNFVECPWTYAYAWPIDAVQGRWMPWNPTNAQPETPQGVPLTTGVSALTQVPMMPGRFLVSSSDQYPVELGNPAWDQQPDLQRTEGLGPTSRKVILTDCCDADFVYTRLVTTIEEWDDLFREAMVMMMALVLAPVALDDPKERIAQRDKLIPILKNAIADARVANGNESGFPQSVDRNASWISARNGWVHPWSGNNGTLYSGYTFAPYDASMQWAGSVF